jgi:hypothetical protein
VREERSSCSQAKAADTVCKDPRASETGLFGPNCGANHHIRYCTPLCAVSVPVHVSDRRMLVRTRPGDRRPMAPVADTCHEVEPESGIGWSQGDAVRVSGCVGIETCESNLKSSTNLHSGEHSSLPALMHAHQMILHCVAYWATSS